MAKLQNFQTKSDTSLGELAHFMKPTFIVQDKVISSLKQGKEITYDKLTTISSQVTIQMQVMNAVITEVHTNMRSLADKAPTLNKFEQNQQAIEKLRNDVNFILNQSVLLEGLNDE